MTFVCGDYRVRTYNDYNWVIEYRIKHKKENVKDEWNALPFYTDKLETALLKLAELVANDPAATVSAEDIQDVVKSLMVAYNDGVAAMTKEAMA